jgi:hypothetical protein
MARLLVTSAPALHLPITDADDLRRLPPGNALGYRSQDHFLHFHRPLQDSL